MSIKAYVGRMGSGKTYEVVSVVILGALARGRRVVSNIAGLNYPAMLDLLVADGVPADKIGELVQIEHGKVLEPDFWRTDKDVEQGIEAFIQPGDLVALDEIWRFWEGFSNRKMPDRVMNFYRMHRHFTHPETGVACDVALITQDVMDISRMVRAVIEETYHMEKLTSIGSSKRYRVDVHQGWKTSRKPLRQIQRTYDARFFSLYSSHSQKKDGDADAVEENIDDRGNILKGVLFKVILPVGVVVFILAGWFIWHFFHPKPLPSADNNKVPTSSAAVSVKPSVPDVSDSWRVVGWIGGNPMRIVISDGRHWRIVEPLSWKISGLSAETFLPSGEPVTSWSGSTARAGIYQVMGR